MRGVSMQILHEIWISCRLKLRTMMALKYLPKRYVEASADAVLVGLAGLLWAHENGD